MVDKSVTMMKNGCIVLHIFVYTQVMVREFVSHRH